MLNSLNKRIPTTKGVFIIILVAIIAGGILVWQYLETPKEKIKESKETFVEIEKPGLNLITTKLAIIPEKCEIKPIYYEGATRFLIKELISREKDCYASDFTFSPNGKRMAYILVRISEELMALPSEFTEILQEPVEEIEECRAKYFVVVDDEESQDYDFVRKLTFSSDSKRLFYIAEKEAKEFVVVDNKESQAYDKIKGFFVSPDGKHLAYFIKSGEKWRLVLDNKETQNYYDDIYNFTFSPDSEHFAYTAEKDGKSFIILDNIIESNKSYDYISWVTFSPDSKHFAYIAVRGDYRSGEWFVVLDGKEGPVYNHTSSILFTPDSKHLIYVAKRGDKKFVVFDEEEYQAYDKVWCPEISSDGQHLAYQAKKERHRFVVLNGKEGQKYESVGPPEFSPNSKHLAYYVVKKDGKEIVVFDGIEGKAYNKISDFIFSSDSEHFAYIGINGSQNFGKRFIVRDGKESEGYDFANSLTFSPNSKNLAYKVNQGGEYDYFGRFIKEGGKWYVITNDKKHKVYDDIYGNLFFTPDSKHIGYGARIGNELWWVMDKIEEFGEQETVVEDETADWRTYRDEEYGFEIKYPSDWNWDINPYFWFPNIVFCNPESSLQSSVNKAEYFGVGDRGETKGCKPKETPSSHPDSEGQIWLFVNNISTNKYEGCSECPIREINGIKIKIDYSDAFWVNPSNSYSFTLTIRLDHPYNQEDLEQYREIFNQMLSTFRFLE